MGSSYEKSNRILKIFYRAIRGEELSVRKLADEHQVSSKTIARDMTVINNFLAENWELTGNAQLQYSSRARTYHLERERLPSLLSDTAFIQIRLRCEREAVREVRERFPMSRRLENQGGGYFWKEIKIFGNPTCWN